MDMDIADNDELDQSMGAANGDVTTNGYVEEDTAINSIEDDSMQVPQNAEDTEMGDAGAGAIDESMPLQEEPPEEPSPPKKGRGRPKGNRASDVSVLSLSTATRGRGRPPTVHRDADDEQQAESSSTAAQKGKRGRKEKALRDVSAARGPNAKINSRGVSKTRAKAPSRSASCVSISRVIQRSETPGTGEGSLVTQSGRVSIKPLAHWRGEKAIFDPGSVDKSDRKLSGLSLGGMTEVIRTEVVDDRPTKKKSGYRRPAARAKSRRLEDVEEEDEDKEPWELETGVLNATVMQWDSTTNHYIEDQTEEKGMVSCPCLL